MKKVYFFILTMMALVACEPTGPEPNSQICSGHIFGTLGCCDENYTTFYKGYFIATDDKDTILSFNIDVKDSIDVISGTHRISDREIPYSFYVTILTPIRQEVYPLCYACFRSHASTSSKASRRNSTSVDNTM